MASRSSPRNSADRRRPEPVGRDLYEAANYAACTLFTQIVDRLPGGAKQLGEVGAERAYKIAAYVTHVSIGDLMRLADAGLRDEVVALLLASVETIKNAPRVDGEATLAAFSREVGEAIALDLEAQRDPSLRRRAIDEKLDVLSIGTKLVVADMRRQFEDAQFSAIAKGRVAGLRAQSGSAA